MAVAGDALIATARQALGTPYRWGGNSLSGGIDCSGLVQQVYAAHGINLPRVTYDQINVGASVGIDKLRVGDMIFFDTDRNRSGPDHVGIYMGAGKFIHAPRTGDVVKISSLGDSYYSDRFMGGRRVPGVNGSPGGALSEAPAPILDSTELAERYGMSYAFFDSQPELKKLLQEATKGQWTPDRFQASLKNTDWWRENSESARQAQVLARTDPATYRANIEAQRAALEATAVQMGAILTDGQMSKLAKDVVAYQWNDAQIQNFLGRYVDFRENRTLGGMAGTVANQITGQAFQLGIRVSEQQVKNYAAYVVRGVASMEEVQQTLREQAAGTYPGFAAQIAAGQSMQDIASPYVQTMAEELELPDTDINLQTPEIRSALNRLDRDGNPSPVSLTDFQAQIRDDPRWRRTSNAQESVMATARQVLADMGLTAPAGG